MTEILSHVLAAAAVTLWLMAVIGSQANAATVRDHRGSGPPPQTTSQLPCPSYKYCAKQGVIVRDHRTGAPTPGK